MDTIDVRVLQATVEAGFSDMRRELARQDAQQAARHVENTERLTNGLESVNERLDKVNGKVNEAHTKIAVLETLYNGLKSTVSGLTSGIAGRVTRADLQWIGTIVGATAAIIFGTLKLIGKI
jgi:hypothetical protein